MAKKRTEFHQKLCDILGSDQVYYQSPESKKMHYPAIVYKRYNLDDIKADDIKYRFDNAYQVILMSFDPDGEIVDAIRALPYTRFDRHYAQNNLNHDSFIVYY